MRHPNEPHHERHGHSPRAETVEYHVEGSGVFPVDMLRYSAAWPARTVDAVLMLVADEHRTIRLKGVGPIARDRWASFGWRVVETSLPGNADGKMTSAAQ